MSGKFAVMLTQSQHMALIDLIAHAIRCRCDSRLEEFHDCTQYPVIVTTPGELLRLVSESTFFHDGGEVPKPTKARLVGE